MRNEKAFAFVEEGKESIQDRIKQLIGGRSMRQAAMDWGLSYSTLNNYFEKGTTPGLKVVKDICRVENVSLEWLILGTGTTQSTPTQEITQPTIEDAEGKNYQTISAIWSSLEPVELEKLSKKLGRKGADFLTILLDHDIQALHSLHGQRRALALSLNELTDEQVREIYEFCKTKSDHFNVTYKKTSA
ncbi:bacteriophage CI repressor [Escherichia coli]|uniref:helix-turn-helix domain-containing protein n=1 Tax=Escherichia coli TaxID=562 RepID=UPI000FC20719|nr:helix-turn-helix domain-containing protein [Escherichia coli]EEC7727399.1 bacteriophage CI repressor [Escherichia coli]EEQ4551230.1 bacteriophage CI repressor [Escherichia coli]EEZ0302458.1 bacteriophage CI repressor [Escherichia coli]EEZ0798854.1 bacteriophage CI repressor [Escherichia coli]EEZ1655225.1 bacteriophage CI repressor [Escherichia coli]